MRHNCKVKHFGRASGPRQALFRGLVNSLVEHGRIRTTVSKAKELRRHVERAITIGKKGDLATHRLLLSRYPNQQTVRVIMKDLSPRFSSRPGGYTRIIRLGARPGDQAEMAFIEFVDYQITSAGGSEDSKSSELAVQRERRVPSRDKAALRKRKRLRKIQSADRAAAR